MRKCVGRLLRLLLLGLGGCLYQPPELADAYLVGNVNAFPASGVLADGQASAEVVVAVRDSNGNPVPGLKVSVSVDGADSRVSPNSKTTSDQGEASFRVHAEAPGSKRIAARVTTEYGTHTLQNQAKVEFVGQLDETVELGTPRTYTGSGQPRAVSAADLNSDGYAEVVAAHWSSGVVSVWWGSYGGLVDRELRSVGGALRAVYAGPLGDAGPPAILVADANNDKLRVLRPDNGELLRKESIDVGGFPRDIAIGRDPSTDTTAVLVANADTDTLSVLPIAASGGFAPGRKLSVGRAPLAVAAGLTAANEPAVAVAEEGDGKVSIYPLGQQPPPPPTSVLEGNGRPIDVLTADFNNDGSTDLAVLYPYKKLLQVYVQTDHNLEAADPIDTDPKPTAMATGNINGDAYPDLVVVSRAGGGTNTTDSDGTVSVYLGGSDGSFEEFFEASSVGRRPIDVTLGDIDANGRDDIVVANFDSGSITVIPAEVPAVGD